MNQKKSEESIFQAMGLPEDAAMAKMMAFHDTISKTEKFAEILKRVIAMDGWSLEEKIVCAFMEGRHIEHSAHMQAIKLAVMATMAGGKVDKEDKNAVAH